MTRSGFVKGALSCELTMGQLLIGLPGSVRDRFVLTPKMAITARYKTIQLPYKIHCSTREPIIHAVCTWIGTVWFDIAM